MKEIYKIMKNYAYKDMCACGNCGADFYFGGCCEIKKCPICGYGCSEDSDNLDEFQECNLVDFFDYVVESVQHFDNKYTKFTMHGKIVTIDFESSTMTCEDEFGNVESCEVDVWILVALCDVYDFWESTRRKSKMVFTCPHCGSWDCGRIDHRIIENWESDVEVIWYQRCQCDECGKEFWEKTTYVCDQTRVALTDAEFKAIREESMKWSKFGWSE